MELTERERFLIEKAKEEILLSIPEAVGNMITQHMTRSRLSEEFYSKYKEFNDHRDVVASALEEIDGKNPMMGHEEKLRKAVPTIRERINTLKNLDMKSVSKKSDLSLKLPDHGDI